jgi:hypothetical protein
MLFVFLALMGLQAFIGELPIPEPEKKPLT